MLKNGMKAALLMVMVGLFGLSTVALTADEILDQMTDVGEAFMGSGMIMTGHITNDYGNEIFSEYAFHVLAETDHILIYFTEPAFWLGVRLLYFEDEDGETRVWQFLPALGQPKELDSEAKGGSFAGSSMSIGDVAQDDWRDDYVASLSGEETLLIGEQERAAYVLDLTAKESADVDDVRIKMWVDVDDLTELKSEYYNDLGNIRLTSEAVELTEFEGRIMASVQRSADSEVISTSVMEYRRPEAGDFPDEIYLPENITTFDPTDWGL